MYKIYKSNKDWFLLSIYIRRKDKTLYNMDLFPTKMVFVSTGLIRLYDEDELICHLYPNRERFINLSQQYAEKIIFVEEER